VNWEHPALANFLTELAGAGGLVVVDRRGLGCSERFTPDGAPPIETLIDDVLAVIEAAGCERIALVATGTAASSPACSPPAIPSGSRRWC
jgi:pimeloyl-ACP methyl ester carboxylesterase